MYDFAVLSCLDSFVLTLSCLSMHWSLTLLFLFYYLLNFLCNASWPNFYAFVFTHLFFLCCLLNLFCHLPVHNLFLFIPAITLSPLFISSPTLHCISVSFSPYPPLIAISSQSRGRCASIAGVLPPQQHPGTQLDGGDREAHPAGQPELPQYRQLWQRLHLRHR